MNRRRSPFGRKIVLVSVIAVLLFCAPLHLGAQEREARVTTDQAPVIAWLSGLWSNLTAWLAGEIPPPLPGPDQPTESPDGAGCIDPLGGGCGS